jgi:hypothetical protein
MVREFLAQVILTAIDGPMNGRQIPPRPGG